MPVPGTNQVTFPSASGLRLAAKLEWPPEAIGLRAVAIFAHCFTCTKDLPCITRISRALAAEGIAVLRLDFTGLGQSEGDFSHSNFSSNVADLIAARVTLAHDIGPPSDHGVEHAQKTEQRHPETAAVEPQHGAEEHHESRDRTDERPDRRGQDLIVVVLRVRHMSLAPKASVAR